jgi:hypothetical protein
MLCDSSATRMTPAMSSAFLCIERTQDDRHLVFYVRPFHYSTPTMSVFNISDRCLPADPDISGIGVRTAIYAQNLLSFIPAIWALWDGEVTAYELESVETQSTTILITAFAILISAMVKARTLGLSNFHASIVLSLSWMNNTNVFIYFLLYIHHKSQASRDRVEPDVHAWRHHLWNVVPVGWSSASSVHEVGAGTQTQNGENTSAKHPPA